MLTKTKNLREKLTTSKSVNFLLTVYFLVSLIINPIYLQINRFTVMNTLKAKQISIRQFLMAQQIAPVKENKYSGIYLSPLRSETQPSFKVDFIQNLWFDHGTGQGGSIIDLVMKIQNCSFSEAMKTLEKDKLGSSDFSFHRDTSNSLQLNLLISSVVSLQNQNLINYLIQRSINADIARTHCRQVHYTIGDRSFYAIGFCNNAGGYELRNKYYKGSSSPKTITTIDNGNAICLVFEGFMDYLSYLTLKNAASVQSDIVVLNSIVNLDKATKFLSGHQTIHCFLDNDEAGKRTFYSIHNLGKTTIDQSPNYANHKDLNDYLCHFKNRQEQNSRLNLLVKPILR